MLAVYNDIKNVNIDGVDLELTVNISIQPLISSLQSMDFSSSKSTSRAGVTVSVLEANPKIKFQFQELEVITGFPGTMAIYVKGQLQVVVDFYKDYLNKEFVFTDAAGVTYTGFFKDGIVNF